MYMYMCVCLQVNVYKDPITDHGKLSKKGRMTLEMSDGHFVTKTEGTGDSSKVSLQFSFLVEV